MFAEEAMMKRSIASILVTLVVLTSALVVVTPSVSAQQETIIFTASIQAGQEVAPVVVHPTETGANGTAIVTMVVTRTGGVITAATSAFDVGVFGLASNSVVILAHIHEGAAGVNGPIRVDSGLSPATALPATGGFVGFNRANLATSAAQAQAIINNPAGFYFNVHTALSPQGVARGQLVRQTTTPAGPAAPTLSQWGAIIMTLLFLAAGAFFLVGGVRKTATETGFVTSMTRPVVNWRNLARTTLYIEVAIALALVALRAGPVDAAGALTSGLVVAFIIHLFTGTQRR
jgi:hypothetical protein